MSFLKLKNVCIGFEKDLIHQLSFQLYQGDRLIVYGPNGIGKSTLLQALVNPSQRKHGEVTWALNPEEILFIQQQTAFHNQTPDDVETYLLNVLLYRTPWTRVQASHLEQVQKVRIRLGLSNSPLKHLSGGQRQKLKIAQSLLMNTKALLLDEPFNAIDPKSTQEIIQWLNDNQPSMIQVLVLHDFEQILKLKSPILWIQSGSWEILSFEDWFQKVDKKFHNWMHTVQSKPESHEGLAP